MKEEQEREGSHQKALHMDKIAKELTLLIN